MHAPSLSFLDPRLLNKRACTAGALICWGYHMPKLPSRDGWKRVIKHLKLMQQAAFAAELQLRIDRYNLQLSPSAVTFASDLKL